MDTVGFAPAVCLVTTMNSPNRDYGHAYVGDGIRGCDVNIAKGVRCGAGVNQHPEIHEIREITRLAPHGGCNWKGCRECFPRTTTMNTPSELQKELERLTKKLLKTINWETYNKEALRAVVQEIYELGKQQ